MTPLMGPPQHICHITTVHPWNDARIFERMCVGLRRRGYRVTLVAPIDGEREEQGVRVIPTGLRGKLSRLLGVRKLLGRLGTVDADVYHFHDPELLPWMVWFRRRSAVPRRIVYDVHEYYADTVADSNYFGWRPLSRAAGFLFDRLEPRLAGFLDGVVGVTEPIAARFERAGTCVGVVRNMTPLESVPRPLPTVSLPSQRTIVLAGSMDRDRLMPELFDAIASLLPRWPDLHFLGIGDLLTDPYGSELRLHAERLGIASHVTFAPREPWRALQAYLAQSVVGLVLVADRTNWRWGLPIRLFEFMAHGVPIIASDVPLVRDVVKATGCGRLLETGTPEDIAAALHGLLADPIAARKLGTSGRQAVLTRYNWGVELDRLEEIYRSL